MISKRKGISASIILLIYILSLLIIASTSSLIVRGDSEVFDLPDKDSYVSLNSPNENFGDEDFVEAGYRYGDWLEAYCHFNLSNKPLNWKKAELSLYVWARSSTFDIAVCFISEDWNETGITWNNKPNHGDLITTITLSAGGTYKFDISNYITTNELSICINASDLSQSEYATMLTREELQERDPESYDYFEYAYYIAKVIWTSTETGELMINGYSVVLVLSILSILTALILFKKRKMKV